MKPNDILIAYMFDDHLHNRRHANELFQMKTAKMDLRFGTVVATVFCFSFCLLYWADMLRAG